MLSTEIIRVHEMKWLWKVNWKGFGGNRPWPISRYYSNTGVTEAKRTMRSLNYNNRRHVRDRNLVRPKWAHTSHESPLLST